MAEDDRLLNRRQLLKGLAGTLALGSLPAVAAAADPLSASPFSQPANNTIPGGLRGAAAHVGHLLRNPSLTGHGEPASGTTRHKVVIVGGGVAGLSAAWWLQRNGVHDFVLLELEDDTGGNARSGSNTVSAYPWGAHYLPLPGEDAIHVRQLLEELGVITGYNADGLPFYDDYALCAAPHERLRVRGQWQDGLVPQTGTSAADRADYAAFFAEMGIYRNGRGMDGKRAFTIPLALSSQDAGLLALDRISMAQYLEQKGWLSASLRWYVDYCCRDDYGADASRVSAWAGIHYFAARNGRAANADSDTVLTWPQGNGWLVQQLRDKLQAHIRTGQLVMRINAPPTAGQDLTVHCLDTATQQRTSLSAAQVIVATPRFVAQHILGTASQGWLPEYLPWLVANITLREPPQTAHSALAWDNVMLESRSLGYIHARQQALAQQIHETVLTWYEPLDFTTPSAARAWALQAGHDLLARRVLDDLERMHPGIREQVSSLDTWLWGHAMPLPAPDTLWHPARRLSLAARNGNIHFAHSDMSGLSLFEEAQYHGVQAASAVLDSTVPA